MSSLVTSYYLNSLLEQNIHTNNNTLNRNTFTQQETNAEAYIFRLQTRMSWITVCRLHCIV